MAGSMNIRGITIELGADTSKLSAALKSASSAIKSTQSQLSAVERSLKFDSGNTDLLKDKFRLMGDRVEETKEKLKTLQQAQDMMDAEGVDKNSREYQTLQTEIDVTTSKLKGLQKEMKEFGSVGAQKIADVGEKLKGFGNGMADVGKQLTMKVTVPLVAVGTKAASSFAEVDKTMQLTNKTMGNTEEEAKMLDQAMKDAAANSTFGMTDAATATLNFARAGLSATEAADALAPAMNLAAGEGGNLDTVSAGLVATINGFGGSFDEAAQYADVFANACNNSALDIDSLASSMSVAAPVFAAAGYNVNDAALYMGVMANSGIEASVAANALKTGFARLVDPSKDAQEALDKLNWSVLDENGAMKDSITIQAELHDKFAELSEAEQIEAASSIFGKNQMANWLTLINTAPGEVSALSASLQEEGTTAEMAEAMMSGFGGSLEKLKSSVDVAATSLGEALAPMILKVSEAIQKAVDWFNSLSDEQKEMIAKIGLLVAAIGPLLLIVGKGIVLIGQILTFAPAIGAALSVLTGPIGLVVAAVAAAIAIGVALYKNWDTIKAKAKEFGDNISKKWNDLKANTSQAWQNMKDSISNKFNDAKNNVQTNLNNMKTNFTNGVSNIKNGVSTGFENVKTYITTKMTTAVSTAQSKLTEMKNNFTNRMADIKTDVSNKLEDVKSFFSTKLATAASTASTKLTEIRGHFMNRMNDAKNDVSTGLSSIQGFFSSQLGSIASTVSSKMTEVRNSFVQKLEDAKNTISGIINTIKGLFNFSLKLDIKVPHISISGGSAPWGIGGKGSLPSFHVSWYDEGGIFKRPSIIGVGEKRPEFVGALDDLRQIVREESGGGNNALLSQMVVLMSELVEQNKRNGVTVNQTIIAHETSYSEQQKAAAYEFKQIARALG